MYLHADLLIKGRFLEFRRYHNFANLFSNFTLLQRNKQVSAKSKELKVLD